MILHARDQKAVRDNGWMEADMHTLTESLYDTSDCKNRPRLRPHGVQRLVYLEAGQPTGRFEYRETEERRTDRGGGGGGEGIEREGGGAPLCACSFSLSLPLSPCWVRMERLTQAGEETCHER